jgi:hypothetical protein
MNKEQDAANAEQRVVMSTGEVREDGEQADVPAAGSDDHVDYADFLAYLNERFCGFTGS